MSIRLDLEHPWGDAVGGSGVLLAIMSLVAAVILVLVRVMPPYRIGG